MLGVWFCMIGGLFLFSGGLGRWNGRDGRMGERVAAGEVEVDGGGLVISQHLGCFASDDSESSSCHGVRDSIGNMSWSFPSVWLLYMMDVRVSSAGTMSRQ